VGVVFAVSEVYVLLLSSLLIFHKSFQRGPFPEYVFGSTGLYCSLPLLFLFFYALFPHARRHLVVMLWFVFVFMRVLDVRCIRIFSERFNLLDLFSHRPPLSFSTSAPPISCAFRPLLLPFFPVFVFFFTAGPPSPHVLETLHGHLSALSITASLAWVVDVVLSCVLL